MRKKLQTWSDKQNHGEKRPNGALAGDGFPTQKRLSERAPWRVFGMFILRALGRALFMDIRRRAFFVLRRLRDPCWTKGNALCQPTSSPM